MTYKRPAYEQVKIAHGGSTVTLRPSLRAAATLEARFGFPAMFRALEEGNLTIISEIILTASSPQDGATFLHLEAAGRSLASFFRAVVPPLYELVSMLMPAPVHRLDTAAPIPTGKSLALSDYYAHLFESATGWLGWTPAEAWAATPTEIIHALRGQEEHLIFTGVLTRNKGQQSTKTPDPEQAARNEAEGLDPEFDREALRALKAKLAGGA